uniref:OTU domain-containing protein n=1 Tax=viral metagenome TaxID=1070528 RepID=A0A6C0DHJ9_9ZZZZ
MSGKKVPDIKVKGEESTSASASASAIVTVTANSRLANNDELSYSAIINTYACKATDDNDTCMKNKFQVIGLTVLNVVGDGNCLFHSFQRFFDIYNYPEQTLSHLDIRTQAIRYLKRNYRLFLGSFQFDKKDDDRLEALLKKTVGKEKWATGDLAEGLRDPEYLAQKRKLFERAVDEHADEGTYASGIGDILPIALAQLYKLRLTIYDYHSPSKEFRVVNIDPSDVTGQANKGHIRLHRINNNHFNVIVPTLTVERYPRVDALIKFYQTLYNYQMATHLLGHQQGTLAYIENKAEKAMFKHEIDVQTVLQSTLMESVVAYLLHVNEVIPSWKSFDKYAPFLEADVAPVSHKKVSATSKASAAKEPSLASSAYKPIGSATATAAATATATATSASSAYKPIGSTRKASRSPSPLRKSAATKKASSRYPSTTSTSGYAAAAKKTNATKPNVKVAEGKSKSKNFSLFENMLGND